MKDADRYLEHQASTGVRDIRATPGALGCIVVRRDQGDLCEITTISFWDSLEAVRRFAGAMADQARFYPGDDELLVEKDLYVNHHDVVSAELDLLWPLPKAR